MQTGWVAPPQHLASLAVLANPWVLGVSATGLVAEFFVDKVPWLDSIWDGIHTLIRPVGGALLATAIVDAQDPAWQVASLLLGGSAALLSHGAKMSTRAVINTSPEPASNIAVSLTEDAATGTLLLLALSNPIIAIIVALFLTVAAIATLMLLRRAWLRIRGISSNLSSGRKEPPQSLGNS